MKNKKYFVLQFHLELVHVACNISACTHSIRPSHRGFCSITSVRDYCMIQKCKIFSGFVDGGMQPDATKSSRASVRSRPQLRGFQSSALPSCLQNKMRHDNYEKSKESNVCSARTSSAMNRLRPQHHLPRHRMQFVHAVIDQATQIRDPNEWQAVRSGIIHIHQR